MANEAFFASLARNVLRAANRGHVDSCIVCGQIARLLPGRFDFGRPYQDFYRRAARRGSVIGEGLHLGYVAMVEFDFARGTRILSQHDPDYRGSEDLLRRLIRIEQHEAAIKGRMTTPHPVRTHTLAAFGRETTLSLEAKMMLARGASWDDVIAMLRRADANGARGDNELTEAVLTAGVDRIQWLKDSRAAFTFARAQPPTAHWLYMRTRNPRCGSGDLLADMWAAARAGHPRAIIEMADDLLTGEATGVDRENAEVLALMIKAKDDGHVEVLRPLGMRLLESRSRGDAAMGKRFIRLAAERREPTAMVVLGRVLAREGKRDEALRWLRRCGAPRPGDNSQLFWAEAGFAWLALGMVRRAATCWKNGGEDGVEGLRPVPVPVGLRTRYRLRAGLFCRGECRDHNEGCRPGLVQLEWERREVPRVVPGIRQLPLRRGCVNVSLLLNRAIAMGCCSFALRRRSGAESPPEDGDDDVEHCSQTRN